jgi:tellurium resistance protein TerD
MNSATTTGLNLTKGQTLPLAKENEVLTHVSIACGWDVNTNNSTSSYDLDVSVFLLENGRLRDHSDICYFGRKEITGVKHMGDNLTGAGDGDDETVNLDLNILRAEITEAVFVINIYEARNRNQKFGDVKNAFCRAYNPTTREEICRFELSGENHTENAMLIGKVCRIDGKWNFTAIGEAINGDLNEIASRFA